MDSNQTVSATNKSTDIVMVVDGTMPYNESGAVSYNKVNSTLFSLLKGVPSFSAKAHTFSTKLSTLDATFKLKAVLMDSQKRPVRVCFENAYMAVYDINLNGQNTEYLDINQESMGSGCKYTFYQMMGWEME